MTWTPLFLLAGYVVFRLATWATVKDAAARRLWGTRVAVAVLAGLVFWKLTPFFTRSQVVFDHPLLLLYMNGGLAAWLGGLCMGLGVAAFAFWQVRRQWPLPRWRLLVPVGAGAVVAVALLVAQPTWDRPPTPSADARQLLVASLDGGQAALAEAGGKVLVVNFWGTWCPPCQAELPELLDFARRHGSGITLWGVDLIGTEVGGPAAVKTYVESHGMRWPNLLDSGALQRALGVTVVPTTLVFNAKGALVERRVGAVDLGWLMGLETRHGH